MVRFAPLAALILMTLPALIQPAHAQGRVVRRDLGFSFVMPDGYEFAPEEKVPKPYAFKLNGPLSTPTTLIDSPGYVLNRFLIAGIMAASSKPDISNGEGLRLPTDTEFTKMMEEARKALGGRLGMNFQGSADIRIDGVPARAFSVTFEEPVSKSGLRMRLIFASHIDRTCTFFFGCVDSEFSGNVRTFEKMMGTVRWLDRTGLPPLSAPKSTLPKPAPGKHKK